MLEKPQAVSDYKRGKTKAINALMRIIAANSNNRADFRKTSQILKELLEK